MRTLPTLAVLAIVAQFPISQPFAKASDYSFRGISTDRKADVIRSFDSKNTKDFSFEDLSGTSHQLSQFRGSLPLFIFADSKCPSVKAYAGRIRALMTNYQKKGLKVVYVFAMPYETKETARTFLKREGLKGIAVHDDKQKLTKLLDASVTTESFLFDKKGELRYQGRIDDNIFKPKSVTESSLKNAIQAVIDGKAVSKPKTNTIGCSIPHDD